MQSLKTRPGRGGKKISKSKYVPRFIQMKQHYMKCQETFSRGPWTPVQNETFYSCYRATFAAANAANCCIFKLCRCNYRHYSKTNQMLEFHQNQSRNSLYLTAWNYLSDKDKQHKHDAEVHFSDSKFENVKLSSLIGHIPHSAESRIISCIF